MKRNRTLKLIHGLTTAVGGVMLFTTALHAAPFLYNSGELVLAFRLPSNASDYVVNIGRATNFNALPPGTTKVVTNLSVTQLAAAFPTVNGLRWSVAAANRPPVPDANYPLQTLWVTAPRLVPNVQSPAWLRKGSTTQGNAASKIDVVGLNAASYSSSVPSGANNTATGVVIPTANDYAFTKVITDSGDYTEFQGNVESVTADEFDEDLGNISRSDLYEILPGTTAQGTVNTPARYLGYFELKADGSLTFNTGVALPPSPVITGVVRNGDVTTVSFTTVNGATYRLRSNVPAGLSSSIATWTTGAASVVGNGSVLSLSETNSAGARFYAVQAQP